MPLPDLPNWMANIVPIHRAASILGFVNSVVMPHRADFHHLPLQVYHDGVSTRRLPKGGLVALNMRKADIEILTSDGQTNAFLLQEHSQQSLLEAVLGALAPTEMAEWLADANTGSYTATLKAKRSDKAAQVDALSNTERLAFDAQVIGDYATVLFTVWTALARFRARFGGPMSPAVVWPHHFDLSTLVFHPENNQAMDEHGPHLNFGFAPYSATVAQPYLYAYAYPYPESYTVPDLPKGARWQTQDYTGVFIGYDTLQQVAEPEPHIEGVCIDLYNALFGLMTT